jgi:hypothetical protein
LAPGEVHLAFPEWVVFRTYKPKSQPEKKNVLMGGPVFENGGNSAMTRPERLATKIACALGVALLLPCFPVTVRWVAAGGDPQQTPPIFSRTVKCPDVMLASIDHVYP